ncbi:YbhB/YbcL family Raf kinase inhibitor-like protein [Actinoplanes sp. M2I2]|uniref:YbhB/YbcL family Raf kinase inhibitor-like protein n=1 Tax=Actinoplanes sp. M2I2 TaxID=1734444 RepID=UPI0020220419|nr:YbhB/YbcL family Raf kinase inhibitor-like protein [Actinoplanes sp. M2I2]
MGTPYDRIARVPGFVITSTDVGDGVKMEPAQASGIYGSGGQDISPQLSWRDYPAETKSFVVTVYDPTAPTGSGFWHWAVADIPALVNDLPTNAGVEGARMPGRGWQLANDARLRRYVGAAPEPGSGRHDYFIGVHAVDVASLGADHDCTPAFLGFALGVHTLARAVMTPFYELGPTTSAVA